MNLITGEPPMSGASTPSAVNTSRSNSVSDVPDGPGARGSSSLNSGNKNYWCDDKSCISSHY